MQTMNKETLLREWLKIIEFAVQQRIKEENIWRKIKDEKTRNV